MSPNLDVSRLYGDALEAELEGNRLLVDHAVRAMFATALAGADALSRPGFLGPIGRPGEAHDLALATGRGLRQALLDYLLGTGRLEIDADETVRARSGLAVSAAERERAAAIISRKPALADARELLAVFERRAADLLRGADGIAVLRETLGFQRLQSLWERLTLNLPQRLVERNLAAELLTDRMRQQGGGVTVLECGAGVGSVLRRALEMSAFLQNIEALDRYVYTDLNPFLVEWSRDWFRRNAPPTLFRRMEFRTLDLDAIREADVPDAGSIDLVLLDDVAHDVVDLRATLQRLGGMLGEGGWLAMTENFRQPARDFMFVEMFPITFHSYNKSRVGQEGRHSRGFMTLAEWRDSLAQAGLRELRVVPDPHLQPRWPMGALVASPQARGVFNATAS